MPHVNEDFDPIDIAFNKTVNDPSILNIKKYLNKPNFSEVVPNEIEKEVKNLGRSKRGIFKKLLQNLSKKRHIHEVRCHIYVARCYAIYGPNKLYEKGPFQRSKKRRCNNCFKKSQPSFS